MADKKEMTALEYLKWRDKMCNSFDGCSKCELSTKNKHGMFEICVVKERENPEEAVAIVQNWAKENTKTLMDDFFEKYPNAPKLSNGAPETCPSKLGYDDRNGNCVCPKDCIECWSIPLEG